MRIIAETHGRAYRREKRNSTCRAIARNNLCRIRSGD